MPTILTHAVAGAAIAQVLAPRTQRTEISWLAAGCAMLPDVDVVGFGFGVQYGDVLGHRGLTHSLLFAVLLAGAMKLFLRRTPPGSQLQLMACLFAATASHGFLDAFTNGGLGVAFFSPFDTRRYFFPARPIMVSPIGISAFLTHRGLSVLLSEMTWVWTASIAVVAAARIARSGTSK